MKYTRILNLLLEHRALRCPVSSFESSRGYSLCCRRSPEPRRRRRRRRSPRLLCPASWIASSATTYRTAGGTLRLRALAYAVQDSLGYIIGAYGYGRDSTGLDTGKFILTLRRGSGGHWLIAGDIDNTNRR